MHDDPQLNLAQVKQQISDWRTNKISNLNKIPEEIKTAVANRILYVYMEHTWLSKKFLNFK